MLYSDVENGWEKDHIINGVYPIGHKAALVLANGKGIILRDMQGREYIDMSAQLTCVNLGHGNEELINAAISEIRRLQFVKLFHGYFHPTIINCAKRLTELTPEGLDSCFFTGGGSESVEIAFQIARLYWYYKKKPKYKIISLYDSYHGITLGALSATGVGKGSVWRGIGPLPPGFIHIPSYNCYYCMFDMEYPACDIRCARFLEETILKEGPDSIAAFIAEPVQGVGGMICPPPDYWRTIREICTKYDVLLVVDEIQTGFCRTGRIFATEHWAITPDMMVIAKGFTSAYLPMGAAVFRREIFDCLKGHSMNAFTYSGNPVAAAVAIKAMEIYTEENVAKNAVKVGKHILNHLNSEFKPLPSVDNISGLGLMIGFNLVKDKTSKTPIERKLTSEIQNQAMDKGLLIRCTHAETTTGSRVCITPPLVISIEEADRALDILKPIIAGL